MNQFYATGLLVASVLCAGIIGCNRSSGPTEAPVIPDQTNGRVTIINDEAKLAARVTINDEPVPIDTAMYKASGAAAFSLKLAATISPPVVGGQTLQATSVVLDGNFAYASYNMQGSTYIGAIDIIQVKGAKNATLRSEATFTDTDVSSLCYANGKMYLAEATGNTAFAAPAVVEAITISGGKMDLAKNFRRALSSYAATAVSAAGGKVFVTTGNTGGLYTLTQNDTLSVEKFDALDDARWVDNDGTYVVVAQGTPGRFSVFQQSTMAFLKTVSFSGATIPESKSTVRLIGGKALVAAGDGGVQLVDVASGTVVGSIPRTVVRGLDSSVTVTNAVDAADKYVYISNGEGGVYVALASVNLSNITGTSPITFKMLGKLQFANLQSVNHVSYDGSLLAVAAGLGGVKFVTVSF